MVEITTIIKFLLLAIFSSILLTSLTTFFGLFPLLMEKSVQAQFLIPMAISLAFGVLFATLITLVIVPSAYLLLDNIVNRKKAHNAHIQLDR